MLSRSMEVHLHFSEVAVYNYELNATEMCEKFFSFFVYAMWQDVSWNVTSPHDLRRRVSGASAIPYMFGTGSL